MCGAGDDKDDDNGSGMSPGESQARFGTTNMAGQTPDISDYRDMPKDDYVADALSDNGYSDNFKGVRDRYGNAVLDGNGNPVLSGTYVNSKAKAESTYDAYQDYTAARDQAMTDFDTDMQGRSQIDQSLINMSMDGIGYASDFYNEDGELNPDFDPTLPVNTPFQGPASPQNMADYANFLGSNTGNFSFPGYNFADPYGTAMAPTLGQIDGNSLGSEVTTTQERDYFDNFQSGYNDVNSSFFGMRGNKFEADKAGNIGISTGSQRLGDAVGNTLMSVAGGAFGPLGSALAAGTNINTMNPYGEAVPGFNPTMTTTSFGPANAFGGMLGNALGSNLAPQVGQAIYDGTGSANTAIAGAVATGMGMGSAGSSLGSLVDNNFNLGYVGSSTSSPMQDQIDANMENRGFGDSVGGNGGGGNEAPTGQLQSQLGQTGAEAPAQNIATSIGDTEIQNAASEDVGSGQLQGQGGETEFDPLQFFLEQANNANPNSVQATDLFGNSAVDLSSNPLLSASAPGVQYLSQGRQRQFGTGTYSVQNAMQNAKSTRRGGIGDRLIGVVV